MSLMGMINDVTKKANINDRFPALFKDPISEGKDQIADLQAKASALLNWCKTNTQIETPGQIVPPATTPGPSTFTSVFDNIVLTTLNFSDIDSHLSSKVTNFSTEFSLANTAVSLKTKVEGVDSLTHGISTSVDTIKESFPATAHDTKVGESFTTLTQSNTKIKNGALNALKSFDSVSSLFKHASINEQQQPVEVPFFPSGANILSNLDSGNTELIAQIKNQDIQTAMIAAFDDYNSKIASIQGELGGLIDAEKQSMSSHHDLLTGFNFMSMLTNPNPLVAAVMSAIVNPLKVDTKSLVALVSPKIAIDSKTETVSSVKAKESPTTIINNNPPTDSITTETDKYSESELAVMKAKVQEKFEAKQAALQSCSEALEELKAWTKSVNLKQKKLAVGITVSGDAANTAEPTITSDPAALQAWYEVRDEFKIKSKQYNTNFRDPTNAKIDEWDAYAREYNFRSLLGRHPYTSSQRNGVVLDQPWTDFLDPGNL